MLLTSFNLFVLRFKLFRKRKPEKYEIEMSAIELLYKLRSSKFVKLLKARGSIDSNWFDLKSNKTARFKNLKKFGPIAFRLL